MMLVGWDGSSDENWWSRIIRRVMLEQGAGQGGQEEE